MPANWLCLLGCFSGALAPGCRNGDDEAPRLPAPPGAGTTRDEVLTTAPEDAAVEAGADATTPKRGGPGIAAPSLKACCAAVAQNAASAPEPQATYMKQAAATCSSMVASGASQSSITRAIQAMIRDANLPSACR